MKLIEEKEETEEKEIWAVWRDTRGKHGRGSLWELSTRGNIRRNGNDYIPRIGKNGYLGFGSKWSLHRAVAELFIPNPENKPTVDHINRVKTDNRVQNLRWATIAEQNENRDNEAISKALKGKPRSEEVKQKISQSKKGKPSTFKGKHHSAESRKKLSEAHKGQKVSAETRKKLSEALKGERNPWFGRHHSEEARRKMREAHSSFKGERNPMYGRRHTEESKQKMRDSIKKAWARRKANIA